MTKNNLEEQFSQDAISFGLAFKAGLVIVIVSAIAIAIASYFNQQRQDHIVRQYTQETELYLVKHEAPVKELFAGVFERCQSEYEATRSGTTYYSDISCQSAQDHFSQLNLDELKDSSAVAFLRMRDDTQYALIEASGTYRYYRTSDNAYFLSWQGRDDLIKYLVHGQEITMWNDFINYIPGKEVIVPVEYDGQVYGYIFRGVIEK